MTRNIQLLFLLIPLGTLSACTQEPPILQEKTEFGNTGWNRFKYLEYSPEIIDNSIPYIFTLKVGFTDEYDHNFFKIQLSKELGGESYVKVFSVPIKNREGVFLENPENGIYKVTIVLSRQIYFSSPGIYQVTIEQLMPKFDTKGIKSAEFIIEKRSM